MKLEIIERRKKDPRYHLLKFVQNYLTDGGKFGKYRPSYAEWHQKYPNIVKRGWWVNTLIKELNLRQWNYDTYKLVWEEMRSYGYDGPCPVYRKRNVIKQLVPHYLSEEFLNDNKKVLGEYDVNTKH
jgi:hypothetical protein